MDYALILSKRYNNSKWILNGDAYEGIEWLSDDTKPSKQDLDSQWESVLLELEAEKSAKTVRKQELLDRLGITEEEAKLLLS